MACACYYVRCCVRAPLQVIRYAYVAYVMYSSFLHFVCLFVCKSEAPLVIARVRLS